MLRAFANTTTIVDDTKKNIKRIYIISSITFKTPNPEN